MRDSAVLWRPSVDGVEVLHAHFRRHEYARHAHESTTVALVDSGAAAFAYRGENFVAPAGSAFVIDAGAVHTGRPANDQGYRYRVLYLDQAAIGPLLAGDHGVVEPLHFAETVVRDPRIARLLDRVHRVLVSGAEPLLQEQALLQVYVTLWQRSAHHAAGPTRSPGRRHQIVTMVRDYLEAHATDKVRLQDLAELTGSSPYSLVRTFSDSVGMPPHGYQTQIRIWHARRLLSAGVPPVSVANQLGFCDQPHLTRMFKKYTGVTPGQFIVGIQSDRHDPMIPIGFPVRPTGE